MFTNLRDIPLYLAMTHNSPDGLVVLKVKPKRYEPHRWFVEAFDVDMVDGMGPEEYKEACKRRAIYDCPIHHYGRLRIETDPECVKKISMEELYGMDFGYTEFEQKLLKDADAKKPDGGGCSAHTVERPNAATAASGLSVS